MIGLKRGIVKLQPYHKGWARAFQSEKKQLMKKLGSAVLDIQHVGSTAIPKMPAKPIIDMSLGVKNLSVVKRMRKKLAAIGYNFHRKSGNEIFFAKGPDIKRTHYLHVMKHKGRTWQNDLLFRNYLLAHPHKIREYSRLKSKLAKRYPEERDNYTAGKESFIKETLKQGRNKR